MIYLNASFCPTNSPNPKDIQFDAIKESLQMFTTSQFLSSILKKWLKRIISALKWITSAPNKNRGLKAFASRLHHNSLPLNCNLNPITVKACVPGTSQPSQRLWTTVCVCLSSQVWGGGVVINWAGFQLCTLFLPLPGPYCLSSSSTDQGIRQREGVFSSGC